MTVQETSRSEVTGVLTQISGMPAFLESALTGKSAEALAWRPGPELFSLVEHACHLRDLEREGYLVRLRRVLAERVPELTGFDGAAAAKARDYRAQDARAAARDFARARAELVAAAGSLTPAELAREAIFGGKRITLSRLLAMVAGHDAEHHREIEELLAHPACP